MRRLVLMTVTVLALLAGCTSGSDSDGSDSPGGGPIPDESPSATSTQAASGPDCASIWVAGQTLPADYETCQTDGAAAEQDVVECTDGTSLVVYADAFYAVTGQEILRPADQPLQDGPAFSAAYSACAPQ